MKKNTKQKILWFVGLYVISVVGVAAIVFILKLFIPH